MTANVPATPLPSAATDVAPTILVIEDDPGVQTALQLLLEDEGYRVELAAEGAAGLARIVNGDVDLVLLDLMLPDMDGLEVCERARSQWSRFYPPIIMLTALSGLEQRRRGLAAGADDYISKPYDASMLLDRVQTWVRVRDHLKAAHEALEEATRREVGAQLESLGRAGRELAHLLNNELALPTGVLNLLEEHPDAPADLRPLIEKAAADLAAAGRHVDAFRRVVEAAQRDSPSAAGPPIAAPEPPSYPETPGA
jgi:DNA-binding response OmpR family regulator